MPSPAPSNFPNTRSHTPTPKSLKRKPSEGELPPVPINKKKVTPTKEDQEKEVEQRRRGSVVVTADFGEGRVLRTRAPKQLQQPITGAGAGDGKRDVFLGEAIVGMLNVDLAEEEENGFLLLGFVRREDDMPVPLSVDRVGEELPPAGAHLL